MFKFLSTSQKKKSKSFALGLRRGFALAFFALICALIVCAIASGPNNPSIGADDSSTGTISWSNPTRIVSSNNSYATARLDDNQISHYLKATNFSFAIPFGAVINGITAEIEKKSSNGSRIKDYQVRIIKGGAIGAINRAISSWWGTSDTYATYGSSSDLWGESWTYSDINDANFGVAISAYKNTAAGGVITASIDHIRITVAYTANTVPNAPILISPNNGSITNDNTPTLSANYSDADIGDTGTTNYRVATSAANCTAGTVVASGTSAQTASNNQDTAWTPVFSIGSDATYYWCSQNNDGVATSSWTSMGNFVLDATGPVITIIASIKLSSSTITNTTISIADNSAVVAGGIAIDASTTAGYSNFNCIQADTNIVNCTIAINSSGDLVIKAVDILGNSATQAENNYIIDTVTPFITITAPAKILNTSITNTTVHVFDDIGILSANVIVDASTTAGTSAFICMQTDQKTVDCAIHIDSSGSLTIRALDNGGNIATHIESGYLIDTIAPTVPGGLQAVIGANLTSQNWSWTASTDIGLGVARYLWRVDGGPSGTTTDTAVTTNLPEGSWKFYVKTEDSASNQSAEKSSLLAIFSSSVNMIPIDCSVPLVQVAVAGSISNPYLDLTPIIVQNGDLLVADVSCEMQLKTSLLSAVITVSIPSGANIRGVASAWPDKIIVPPVATNIAANLLPAGGQVSLAIIVGHTALSLEITKGVRIFIEGQAGKKAGYISNNVFTEIASMCAGDSQDVGDALGAGQDCKINSGSDLVIWTKHFSEFIIYTIAQALQNSPLAGGGIGMPVEWYNPPKPPIGGFGISINNGVELTTIPEVVLNLKGGYDTSKMAISNSPDFQDAGQENYISSKIWNLCWKNSALQFPSTCLDGTYSVYAKYYTPWGTASDIVSDKIILKTSRQLFAKNLKFGQISADVKRLQIFLNQSPDTQIAKFGAGSPGNETSTFGFLTKAAMIKFQEKYADEILTPSGLLKGTGICAQYTRAKINKMLGF
ncbi:MAG: hypothetical protein PHY72_01095 [Candidatus Pacebacteria bacterium]|nr:hypothetical protein [Candidatus Paceibacterota bacterium]